MPAALLSDLFHNRVPFGSGIFGGVFAHLDHLDLERSLSEIDFDEVALLHVVGRTGNLAVHHDPARVARLVRNCAAFDQAGYFEIFIKPHRASFQRKNPPHL